MAEQYDLDDPVYGAILQANIHLMLFQPFFGQLVSRMDIVLCDNDSWCKTAATDGRHLYFNRDFTSKLTKAEIVFVLAHEILHCLYDHLGRRRGREPQLWNMANDFAVNYTLVSEKIGQMPSMGLYDARFTDEMTSEEIYAILKKNSVEIQMTLDQHLEENYFGEDDDDDGKGDEKDENGGGNDGDEDGDGDDGDQQGNGGGDGDEDGKGKGKGSGQGDGDEDGDGQGGAGGGNGQKKVKVTVTGKDGPPKLSKEDIEEIQQKMRAAAIQAAQTCGAGKVPAGIMRRLGELIEPKLDWRALLDSHIRSALKDDFTFMRLSRRELGGSFVMPAQDILEVVEVDVAVDTSGSMSEQMLRDIFSEIKGIMQSFPDFKLRAWTFDTQVYGFKEFTPHNLHEIDNYAAKAQGGGGTMFECNWEFMRQEDIMPHRLVVFTDGYPCGSWGDKDYCDTLFVIHGNKTIKAPFGMTAYYDEPEKLAEAA